MTTSVDFKLKFKLEAKTESDESSESEKSELPTEPDILYFKKYVDDNGVGFRFVILPKCLQELYRTMSQNFKKTLSESECQVIGIRMSPGWSHFHFHGDDMYSIMHFIQKPKQKTNNI